jgi:hypothetical protein
MALRRILPSRVTPASPEPSGVGGAGAPAEGGVPPPWPETPSPTAPAADPAATASPPEPSPFDVPTAGQRVTGNDLSAAAAEAMAPPPAPVPVELPPAAPAAEAAAPPPADTGPQPAPPELPESGEPSRPDAGTPRRRVKTPRSFVTTPAEPVAEAAVVPPPPATHAVEEADRRLAEAGLITPPPADPLTASLPPALPEAPETFSVPAAGAAPAAGQPPIDRAPAADLPLPVHESPVPLPPPEPAGQAPASAAADLPAPRSDLPWAQPAPPDPAAETADAGWDIGTPPAAPPPDIFRDVSAQKPPEPLISPHPWQTPPGGGNRPPPELPSSSLPPPPRGGSWQLMLAAAVVAAVLFLAYHLVSGSSSNNRMQEQLARWTGSLREAPEVLPGTASSSNPAVQPSLQPQQMIAMNGLSGTILPPPVLPDDHQAASSFSPLPITTSGTAVVDFADVPPSEANKPIVADGSEKMPADIGFVASLQQAIANEKAKSGEAPAVKAAEAAKADDKNLTPEQKLMRGQDLKAQLDEELAAYRKALADSPNAASAPKPTEFFKQPNQFMNARPQTAMVSGSNVLLPPTVSGTAAVTAEGLPPAELYTNNPKNLPTIPEPAAEAPKVRTLADFDVNVFAPEEPKVRMPKGVVPHIASGDFPALDILSLVPGKGLIAYYEGKEGVLLLGQQVAGWKLVGVNEASAEFKAGERRQTVRPD